MFFCYRRSDDPDFVGRFHDRLTVTLGDENVFRDIDTIRVGRNFANQIRETFTDVDAVVVMIGPAWHGDRLHKEDDVVRMELLEALQRNVPIIPILIKETALPDSTAFPSELRSLLKLHVARVRGDPDFRRDAEGAIAATMELADAHHQRRQDAARQAEAEKQRIADERARREAVEAERQRLVQQANLARAEAEATARRTEAERLAVEHADRTAAMRRHENELAARRLAEERAELAEIDEGRRAAAAAAAAAADDVRRLRESLSLERRASEFKAPAVERDLPKGSSRSRRVRSFRPAFFTFVYYLGFIVMFGVGTVASLANTFWNIVPALGFMGPFFILLPFGMLLAFVGNRYGKSGTWFG